MATSVDMSLDDIIKNRRNSDRTRGRGRGRRGRGQGRTFSGGNGVVQRRPLAVNARPSPYTITKSFSRKRSFPWQTDLFEDSIRAVGIQGVNIGTQLYVSNLDYGVTNNDIRELFSEIGDIKRYAIHFDKTGRPSGSAEVVYSRRSDAFLALKRYNNVLLDGKPMRIEIVGANSEVPITARVNATGLNGGKKRTLVMPGQVSARAPTTFKRRIGNRNLRGGFMNGRGRGKKQQVEKSAEQLDKELENYHSGAMDTN
ncbi:hypothetical protein SAY87_014209 [Trapa incisa]|uniref:RRM domain-containing protein n=1 Tax=Trapa incisa TaxID=236973 RepID=A0AAN7JLC0_9MYRT|nr:hypothetical protein SAY87_014209 [Trapa incisa]